MARGENDKYHNAADENNEFSSGKKTIGYSVVPVKNRKQTVFTSSVINAPVDDVWVVTRDFDGFPLWHSAVSKSFIEGGDLPDKVGCIRNFTLVTGETVRERLLTLCDRDKICRYALLDGPLPMHDYVATFQLMPVIDSARTFITWQAEFYTNAAAGVATTQRIEEIFQQGFDTLKQRFAKASLKTGENNGMCSN